MAVTQPGVDVVLQPGRAGRLEPRARAFRAGRGVLEPRRRNIRRLAGLLRQAREGDRRPARSGVCAPTAACFNTCRANVVLYGAVPNLGGTIGQAMVLAEQQSAENPVFRDWWNSGAGQELRQLVDRIQTRDAAARRRDRLRHCPTSAPESEGRRSQWSSRRCSREASRTGRRPGRAARRPGGIPLPYSLADTLMVASDSQTHLQWVLEHLGQGAATPFADGDRRPLPARSRLAARHGHGAGTLGGVRAPPKRS